MENLQRGEEEMTQIKELQDAWNTDSIWVTSPLTPWKQMGEEFKISLSCYRKGYTADVSHPCFYNPKNCPLT